MLKVNVFWQIPNKHSTDSPSQILKACKNENKPTAKLFQLWLKTEMDM